MSYRLALFLFVVAGGLSGCQSTRVAPIDAGVGPFAPERDERKLWDDSRRIERRIEEVGLLYTNATLEAYIHSVATRLAAGRLSRPGLELKVRVLKMPSRNAFVFPHGVFYITTGMLACLDSEAELAAVLAHEMAHFIGRHGLKESRSAANKQAWLNVLGGTTMLVGLAPLVVGVGSAWARSAILGYSRELETEADEAGLEMVARAGYDPRPSLKVFDCQREEEELLEDEARELPATHPPLHERLDRHKALLASKYAQIADSAGRDIRRQQYMAHIGRLLLDNAMLDLEAGRLDFAQRAVDKYIREWPDSAPGHFHLGEIWRRRRQPAAREQAEAAYRQAARLDPNYAEPRRELGLLYREAGRLEEAREQFAAYVALASNAVDADIFRSYIAALDAALAEASQP